MVRYAVAVAGGGTEPPSGTYDSLEAAKAAIRDYAAKANPPWPADELARLERELAALNERFPGRIQGHPARQEWIYISPLGSRKRAGA